MLLLTFAISLWNAYASGYNIGLVRKNNISGFQKYASYSGLGLAFVGMTYVLVIVLSILAYILGYVGISTVSTALALNFLVFGLLIIGFGIMVTIQSITIAYQRRSFWSILIAVWNTFAIIFDVYAYASGFKQATTMISGNRRQQGNAVVIILAAALIAFFIVHSVYKRGLDKALGTVQGGQAGGSGQQTRQSNFKSERVRMT